MDLGKMQTALNSLNALKDQLIERRAQLVAERDGMPDEGESEETSELAQRMHQATLALVDAHSATASKEATMLTNISAHNRQSSDNSLLTRQVAMNANKASLPAANSPEADKRKDNSKTPNRRKTNDRIAASAKMRSDFDQMELDLNGLGSILTTSRANSRAKLLDSFNSRGTARGISQPGDISKHGKATDKRASSAPPKGRVLIYGEVHDGKFQPHSAEMPSNEREERRKTYLARTTADRGRFSGWHYTRDFGIVVENYDCLDVNSWLSMPQLERLWREKLLADSRVE